MERRGKGCLNWGGIIINIKTPLQRSFPCANAKFHPTKFIENTIKVYSVPQNDTLRFHYTEKPINDL